MVADPVVQDFDAADGIATATAGRRGVLDRLEKGPIGTREADGSVRVRRAEVAGCFLYGPYLHLPQGRYRLCFSCRCGAPALPAQPALGVEIIVLSRFQQRWCDFTASELAAGSGSLEFAVPREHSLEGENEGRFEFRFFHLGNADLEVTAVELEGLGDPAALSPASTWRLLGRLQKSRRGRRAGNGSVAVRRIEPAGLLLYGAWPYLRLPRGSYRLSVAGTAGAPLMPGQPVLGIEVLGRSRWLSRRRAMQLARLPESTGTPLAWRDVIAEEIAAGATALDFDVPTELSLEAGADAPVDVRLHHLGNAALRIDAVDLQRLDGAAAAASLRPVWRLLGRLRKGRIGRHDGCGIAVRHGEPPGRLLIARRALPCLPEGRYRLRIAGSAEEREADADPLLRMELIARPPLGAALQSWRQPRLRGGRTVNAAELQAGTATLDFEVPAAFALGAGNWRLAVGVHHLGAGGFRIDAVDIARLAEPVPERGPVTAPAIPSIHPAARRKIVIIGNCQSETLRQGFSRIEALNQRFEVKYHFIQLPKNLHEFAARDLENCDIVLIQDIRLWDEFPLREAVRPGAEAIRYPLVRFASLWPFDAWNGPGDKEAYDREAPNLTFPYLDGLLGRMRKEIPDPEARFRAYRDLDFPGTVNYRRLHELEVRRLAGMDRKFGFSIGGFILDNFQDRRVFHTTVRPNWEVFNLLMQFVAKAVGAGEPVALTEAVDASLRNPQVPVHPKVARDLGVRWIDDDTRYLDRGIGTRWEDYIRLYIRHYG